MPLPKKTIFVPFEEWTPDRAKLTTGVNFVRNLIAAADGYEMAPGFAASQIAVPPEKPMLIRAFKLPTGDISTLIFCRTKIYLLTGAGWADYTRESSPGVKVNYTTQATDWWSAVQWGDYVYATNYRDPVQRFRLTGGIKFNDVAMKTGGFRCRHLIIVRDFLVGLDTNDDTGSNANPFGISWSGRLRPDDMEPSLATQANYRDIVDIGNIVNATGGDFGIVLGETGMATLDYIGPPVTWQISKKEEDVGCLIRGSMIKAAGIVYWYSQKGWRSSNGGPSQPIGATKVDSYSRRKIDLRYGHSMSAIALADKPVIAWSFVGTDSADKLPDNMIYLQTTLMKFSEGDFDVECLGTSGTPEIFMDDPVWGDVMIDTMSGLVDSSGDIRSVIVALDRAGKIIQMTPTADTASLTSKEVELIKGMRSRVIRVRLVAEGATEDYMARVNTRDRLPTPDISTDPWLIPERTGSCGADKRGRYHRFNFQLTGDYTNILGVDVTYVPAGEK